MKNKALHTYALTYARCQVDGRKESNLFLFVSEWVQIHLIVVVAPLAWFTIKKRELVLLIVVVAATSPEEKKEKIQICLFFIVNVDTLEEMNVDMVLAKRVKFNVEAAVVIKPLFCFLELI